MNTKLFYINEINIKKYWIKPRIPRSVKKSTMLHTVIQHSMLKIVTHGIWRNAFKMECNNIQNLNVITSVICDSLGEKNPKSFDLQIVNLFYCHEKRQSEHKSFFQICFHMKNVKTRNENLSQKPHL